MKVTKYKCIKPINLDMYGDNGELLDEHMRVVKDSVWEVEETDYYMITDKDGIRLINNLGSWIEIYENTLLEHFELIN